MSTVAPGIANPGVKFPPPLLFVAGLAVGWVLDRYVYSLPLPRSYALAAPIGAALIVLGLALLGWGMITFVKARTAIIPHKSASRIVQHGPYRFTRNPMYTGLTIVYLGVTLQLATAWPLIILPVVLVTLFQLVISREEAYLASAFGPDYADYCKRVRRWV